MCSWSTGPAGAPRCPVRPPWTERPDPWATLPSKARRRRFSPPARSRDRPAAGRRSAPSRNTCRWWSTRSRRRRACTSRGWPPSRSPRHAATSPRRGSRFPRTPPPPPPGGPADVRAADTPRRALPSPASGSAGRQAPARGQAGTMTASAYANRRGYGPSPPPLAELRVGALPLTVDHPRTGEPVRIGALPVTEAEAVGQRPTQEGGTLGVGYGCAPGHGERRAVAMAVLDAGLAGVHDDAPLTSPLPDQEVVL